MQVVYDKSWFAMTIWSLTTASSRMITVCTVHYSLQNVSQHNWRQYAEDKLAKNLTFLTPPHLETPKISPQMWRNPVTGTELYHHANCHADRPKISVPRQESTYFSLYWTPLQPTIVVVVVSGTQL